MELDELVAHSPREWAMYTETELLQALRVMGVRDEDIAFARGPMDAYVLRQGIQRLMSYPGTEVHDAGVALMMLIRGRL